VLKEIVTVLKVKVVDKILNKHDYAYFLTFLSAPLFFFLDYIKNHILILTFIKKLLKILKL